MVTTVSAASTQPLFGTNTGEDTVASDKDNLSSDFELFLRMLTVQVQNQDPLNPVDSTDYATQLATFSGVEQQVKTNELLSLLTGQSGSGALQQYGSWIGMEALVRAPVQFEGQPIVIRPDPVADATSVNVVVRGPSGEVLERLDVAVGEDTVVWDGLDETGAAFEHGIYRFDVESRNGDTIIDSKLAQTYSRVDEVRSEGDTVSIRLSDGSEVPASLVYGLRNPS